MKNTKKPLEYKEKGALMMPLAQTDIAGLKHTVHGEKNFIEYGGIHAIHASLAVSGNNNIVILGDGVRLENAQLHIKGNNNLIALGSKVRFRGSIQLRDGDGNKVEIEQSSVFGKANIYCAEGSHVHIGERCMFSSTIEMRTGDGHSIFDLTTGERLNKAENIMIGNHVWIGGNVTILKGAHIEKECMVAANAVVTAKRFPQHSLIGGMPAKILRENILWDHRLLDSLNDDRVSHLVKEAI